MQNTIKTKRTDNKGRILKTGEYQRKDGRYVYCYTGTDGKRKSLYSWRLTATDPLPKGKKPCKFLREMEKEIHNSPIDGSNASEN